jgi:hypothetical protein
MNHTLERMWVNWLDSDRLRQFVKNGSGAGLFRSQTFQRLDTARRFMTTSYKSYRQPGLFQDVKTFCMFIGHVKSGGTLIGSLLDAHPQIVLADEIDALHYVSAGFKRDQIYHLLLKGSQREALKGRVTARRLTPYSLAVPGQWQGRYQKLRVIGDSKAGPSTRKLGQEPELLWHLQQVMAGVDLRFIQVIRNPYDPISAMIMRGGRTFENAVAHYFGYCKTLVAFRNYLPDSSLLAVRYEDFISHPEAYLADLCHFLGVEARDAYLNACASIVQESPEPYRHMVEWSPHWMGVVHDWIGQFDFLAGYSYEN